MQSPSKTIKSIETRVKVLERVLTQKQVAEALEVSERQIRRLLQSLRARRSFQTLASLKEHTF